MTRDHTLRELEDAFQQAVALPRSGRAAFLDGACGHRSRLRRELERMLEANSDVSPLLDGTLPAALAARLRLRVGRWTLEEPIGEGGLGIVYRASCVADGVPLRAAVKVLRGGFDAGVFRDSFVQERSILSGLDHPHIARLIDAGADACGDSFLAMEFVDGEPLQEHLRRSHPPVRDRLDLFTRLCGAVHYLHARRVVHGDIKPSNVMVTAEGHPKLLDFGTARLIGLAGGELPGSDPLARLIMTPGYASPERRAGGGPSVRGDVYSLGCVLRDLLEACRPDADLLAIRDKCLANPPEQRYASAQEIAEEVGRHLRHLPVRARASSGWYVGSRFLRRNRVGCGLAALAALSLVVGWVVSRQQARRAELHARQYRSVVSHLVSDEPTAPALESQQRAVLTAGLSDVIRQLEGMRDPPLGELTSAWRRLSYLQAVRGRTRESLRSIGQSVGYARRALAGADTPTARLQLAESLLHAAHLQRRLQNPRLAGQLALEVIGLAERLPAAQRHELEARQPFLQSIRAAARERARLGDVAGGREILVRGVERSRRLGRPVHLRRLLDLAAFERRVGNRDRAATLCQEAASLGLPTHRLRNTCDGGPAVTPAAVAQRTVVLSQEAAVLEMQLANDPERFGLRWQLAQRKLQLARMAGRSGDAARALAHVEEARRIARELAAADPESGPLLRLNEAIERTSTRLQAMGEPQHDPSSGNVSVTPRPGLALQAQTEPR